MRSLGTRVVAVWWGTNPVVRGFGGGARRGPDPFRRSRVPFLEASLLVSEPADKLLVDQATQLRRRSSLLESRGDGADLRIVLIVRRPTLDETDGILLLQDGSKAFPESYEGIETSGSSSLAARFPDRPADHRSDGAGS